MKDYEQRILEDQEQGSSLEAAAQSGAASPPRLTANLSSPDFNRVRNVRCSHKTMLGDP